MARANLEARLAALEAAQSTRVTDLWRAFFDRAQAVLGDEYTRFAQAWDAGELIGPDIWDRITADPQAQGLIRLLNYTGWIISYAYSVAGRSRETI